MGKSPFSSRVFWDGDMLLMYLVIYINDICGYIHMCIYVQVEPGKPGAEVSKKRNYKSKKEFAYRMCTG